MADEVTIRTEMRILRDDKMRPLFKEVIVTKLALPQSTTRYQMKATEIIFPMISHEFLWITWFGHHSPAKFLRAYFQNKLKR